MRLQTFVLFFLTFVTTPLQRERLTVLQYVADAISTVARSRNMSLRLKAKD